MDDNTLKNIANNLADAYINSETEFADKFDVIKDKIKTAREGYIIGRLCDVYREAKQELYDTDTAKQKQRDVFLKAEII